MMRQELGLGFKNGLRRAFGTVAKLQKTVFRMRMQALSNSYRDSASRQSTETMSQGLHHEMRKMGYIYLDTDRALLFFSSSIDRFWLESPFLVPASFLSFALFGVYEVA